jgi:hypothetical protein
MHLLLVDGHPIALEALGALAEGLRSPTPASIRRAA